MNVTLALLAISVLMKWTAGVDVPLAVKTSSGPVQGHIASHTSSVSEYLGIPFVRSVK
jgi:hypothetical protein